MMCTSQSHFRSSGIFLMWQNHARNVSILPTLLETLFQHSWVKWDSRSQGTVVEWEVTQPPGSHKQEMWMDSRADPCQRPQHSYGEGRTVSRGWLCRSTRCVFACSCVWVWGRNWDLVREHSPEWKRTHRGKHFPLSMGWRKNGRSSFYCS